MSELQRDVARVLRALGVPHQLEALTPDGLFSVDIALPGAARGSRGHSALVLVAISGKLDSMKNYHHMYDHFT